MVGDKKKEIKDAYKDKLSEGGVYSVTNTVTGKILLQPSYNLAGSKSRFDFSKVTGSAVIPKLQQDYNQFGPEAFSYEVLETYKAKPEETHEQFVDKVKFLYEYWLNEYKDKNLY
ncbi:MAG: GIY-YIG nuclease family protein [Clostridia bacterium]|jgi:hypothetical protein|nr:GIY-YIG nuclease family protein [Clostridia bacterium]